MRLSDYLTTNSITQQAFAEHVGCSQGRISQLLAGELPSFSLARKVSEITMGAVTFSDWPAVEPNREAA